MNILSNIKAVLMCGTQNEFDFHSSLLVRRTNTNCHFAKASTKLFNIQETITTPVLSSDFYSLSSQGNNININKKKN